MAAFTSMEEVQPIWVVPWDTVEKGVKDFFREEWVEELGLTMLMEESEEVVVLMEPEGVVEAAEGTLGEAVEMVPMIHVGEEEDLTTLAHIRIMNVVTKQLAMVT